MKLLNFKVTKAIVPRMIGVVCDVYIEGEDIVGKKEITLFYHDSDQKLIGPIEGEIKVILGNTNMLNITICDSLIQLKQLLQNEKTIEINGFDIDVERHQFLEEGFINVVYIQKTNLLKYRNVCHACGTVYFTVFPVIEQCQTCGYNKNNNIEGGE